MEKRKRKTRSDKKHEIKPTISFALYETISRLSYITMTPMKNVGEYLCEAGLNSREVLEVLQKQFRHSYYFTEGGYTTLFRGNPDIQKSRALKESGPKKRLTLRFRQEVDEKIENLAFALGTTPTSATKILLQTAIKNTNLVNEYITKHVFNSLDDARKEELKKVIAYLKKDNPYSEEITFASLISMILDEFKGQTINATRAVSKWIDKVVVKSSEINSKHKDKKENDTKQYMTNHNLNSKDKKIKTTKIPKKKVNEKDTKHHTQSDSISIRINGRNIASH